MSITKELYKLQEIDTELASEVKTHSDILERLKGNPEILTVSNNLESAEKKRSHLIKDQKTLESDINALNEKLRKYGDDLYSGRTSNTKELSGIQHEIELLKGTKAGLEDRELVIMETLEKADTIIEKLGARLEKLTATWQTEEKHLSAKLEETEIRIITIQEKRDKAAAAFDGPVLQTYEELRKLKGHAVVKVVRSICQGCRIQLPAGELEKVRTSDMVRCGSCGRLLLPDQ